MRYKYLYFFISFTLIFSFNGFAQRDAKTILGFGFVYGYANNDGFPVKFLGNSVAIPNSCLGLDFSFGLKIKKVIVRTDFVWLGTNQNNPHSEIYGKVSSSLFVLNAGIPIINKSKISLQALVGLGLQESRFTYTQKNNNSIDSLNSGHTNEISMLLQNLMASGEFELCFKNTGFSVYTGYLLGLHESKITNLSGNSIGNYGFRPNTFKVGIRLNLSKQ